jgi:hypothetical protein
MNQSRRYYGLNGLDEKLESYINYDGGFFVEIGANDGVTQSNTLYFEQFRQWSGILVEPTHLNYFKCRANRAKYTKVFCAARVEEIRFRGEFVRARLFVSRPRLNLKQKSAGRQFPVSDCVTSDIF